MKPLYLLELVVLAGLWGASFLFIADKTGHGVTPKLSSGRG